MPRSMIAASLMMLALTGMGTAAENAVLKPATVELRSAGPMTFGPDGILFVGDPQAARVYAVATGETKPAVPGDVQIDRLHEKLASLLGVMASDVSVADLAVNPISGTVYLSVARGKGPNAVGVILRVDAKGALSEFSLKEVPTAFVELSKPVADDKRRRESITDLKFIKGRLYVAGLSNEEFASTLRSYPFPFTKDEEATAVEIYHGAHGKFETAAPVRTFAAYEHNGETQLLAAYTCTPLVQIPVASLKKGVKVKGKTVAELGNRNRPLDIVVYSKDGHDYALIANSARGVMKVELGNLEKAEAIEKRISGTAGLKYETLKDLTGVMQLDRLDKNRAVILVRANDALKLQTIPLP